MMNSALQHFILTRFNLLLWNKDKEGVPVRSKKWLEHRFELFERFCLPSIVAQTCREFQWIVLFDSTTPERYKDKIEEYKKICPQLLAVYVRPDNGQFFAQIFRDEVVMRLNEAHSEVHEFNGSKSSRRVLTTYLDNDDALDIHFVENIQRRTESLPDGTFINYTDGYQYFTDYNYVMRIRYLRNHFMSVVERADAYLKTIYGYGSHYYIDKIPGVNVECVKKQPMWCEVSHEKNMGNDAYFLNAKLVREANGFGFMIQDPGFRYGVGTYLFRYLPRYCKTFIRRCGYFIFRNRFK